MAEDILNLQLDAELQAAVAEPPTPSTADVGNSVSTITPD